MALVDTTRLLLFGAMISACFGLACNTTTEVALETYGDGAVEDYGCILGDLECGCAAGDMCDASLTCQQGVCKCLSAACSQAPTTGSPGDGDGDDPTTGDGDGDPTTGDGDGDPTTGDGDGDPTTGDGDGDGDGDGE